jgi:hypothetical protein
MCYMRTLGDLRLRLNIFCGPCHCRFSTRCARSGCWLSRSITTFCFADSHPSDGRRRLFYRHPHFDSRFTCASDCNTWSSRAGHDHPSPDQHFNNLFRINTNRQSSPWHHKPKSSPDSRLLLTSGCFLSAAVSMAVEAIRSINDSLQSRERWKHEANMVAMVIFAQTAGSHGTTNVITLKAQSKP